MFENYAQIEFPDNEFLESINDYDSIASVFDEVMGWDFLHATFRWKMSLIQGKKPDARAHGKRWLDLGCGTGLFLAHTCIEGVSGLGIDRSEAVIGIARVRCEELQADCGFIVQDIVEGEYGEGYDVITLNFDALNQIHTPLNRDLGVENWKRVMNHAYHALKPGGVFHFDLNSTKRISKDWEYPEVISKLNVAYIQYGLELEKVDQCQRRKTPMIIFHRNCSSSVQFERTIGVVEHLSAPVDVVVEIADKIGFDSISVTELDHMKAQDHIFLKNREFYTMLKGR